MQHALIAGQVLRHDASRMSALGRGPERIRHRQMPTRTDSWPEPGAAVDLDFENDRYYVKGFGQGSLSQVLTVSRASTATYVGSDGLLKTAAVNEIRPSHEVNPCPVLTNLLRFSDDFNASTWARTGLTVSGNQLIEDTATGVKSLGIANQWGSFVAYTKYILIFEAKSNGRDVLSVGSNAGFPGTCSFNLATGTVTTSISPSQMAASITPTSDGYYECVMAFTSNYYIHAACGFTLNNGVSYTGNGVSGVYLKNVRLCYTNDWVAPQTIGEYLPPPAPLVLAGGPRKGVLLESARTNSLLYCRDATNAVWVKTDLTAALDQVGIDGAANSASSLTATGVDGTCIQTVTAAAATRSGSVYLKRLTGTGAVSLSLDTVTWHPVDLTSGVWCRFWLGHTVTNPKIAIKLATPGDAVAMDYGQIEDAPSVTATSPILTTSAAVTRAADITFHSAASVAVFYNQSWGAWYARGSATYNNTYVVNVGLQAGRPIVRGGLNSGTLTHSAVATVDDYILYAPYCMSAFGEEFRIRSSYTIGNKSIAMDGFPSGSQVRSDLGYYRWTSMTAIYYGRSVGGSGNINGTLSRITYRPYSMVGPQLEAPA